MNNSKLENIFNRNAIDSRSKMSTGCQLKIIATEGEAVPVAGKSDSESEGDSDYEYDTVYGYSKPIGSKEEFKNALRNTFGVTLKKDLLDPLYFKEPRLNKKEYWDRLSQQFQLISNLLARHHVIETAPQGYPAFKKFFTEGLMGKSIVCKVVTGQCGEQDCTLSLPGLLWLLWCPQPGPLQITKLNGVDVLKLSDKHFDMMISGAVNFLGITPDPTTLIKRSMAQYIREFRQLGVEFVKCEMRKNKIKKLNLINSARYLLANPSAQKIEQHIRWILEICDELFYLFKNEEANEILVLIKPTIEKTFKNKATLKKRALLLNEVKNRNFLLSVSDDILSYEVLARSDLRTITRVRTIALARSITRKPCVKKMRFDTLKKIREMEKDTVRELLSRTQYSVLEKRAKNKINPDRFWDDIYRQVKLFIEFLKVFNIELKDCNTIVHADFHLTKFCKIILSCYLQSCPDILTDHNLLTSFHQFKDVFRAKNHTLEKLLTYGFRDINDIVRGSRFFGVDTGFRFGRFCESWVRPKGGRLQRNIGLAGQIAVENYIKEDLYMRFETKILLESSRHTERSFQFLLNTIYPRPERVRWCLAICDAIFQTIENPKNGDIPVLLFSKLAIILRLLNHAINDEAGFFKENGWRPNNKTYTEAEYKRYNEMLKNLRLAHYRAGVKLGVNLTKHFFVVDT